MVCYASRDSSCQSYRIYYFYLIQHKHGLQTKNNTTKVYQETQYSAEVHAAHEYFCEESTFCSRHEAHGAPCFYFHLLVEWPQGRSTNKTDSNTKQTNGCGLTISTWTLLRGSRFFNRDLHLSAPARTYFCLLYEYNTEDLWSESSSILHGALQHTEAFVTFHHAGEVFLPVLLSIVILLSQSHPAPNHREWVQIRSTR